MASTWVQINNLLTLSQKREDSAKMLHDMTSSAIPRCALLDEVVIRQINYLLNVRSM